MADLDILTIALSISNVILFIIAAFLFMRCRKTGNKSEPKKGGSLTGIADITPQEFKPERFELKPGDVLPAGTAVSQPAPVAGIQEKAPLKLEDELPEADVAPGRKISKKRKTSKKESKSTAADVIKELNEISTEKKISKKKKTPKKEPEFKEAVKEEKAATVVPDKTEKPEPVKTGEGTAVEVQANLPK